MTSYDQLCFFLQHGTSKILYDDLGNMETHRNAMP